MGLFYSNAHILKTEDFGKEAFLSVLNDGLKAQGFQPAASRESADLTVSLFDAGGKWLTIWSDGIVFYDDGAIRDVCRPLSERLSTDVVTVSCFDSDMLVLNRINQRQGIEAWAKVGQDPDVRTPAKWKGLVDNVDAWKAALKKRQVFAEEAMEDLEPMLGLEPGQGRLCDDLIPDELADKVSNLYYSLSAAEKDNDLPRLTISQSSLMPCPMGESTFITAVNNGGASKGLTVAFSGSYVEKEEIRFRDVQLEWGFNEPLRKIIPLELEKRQGRDGRWFYAADIKDFAIPEGVKKGLPPIKAQWEEFYRSFGLRFTPEGNPRKRLDIMVHFVPSKNNEGQCAWAVWLHSGSKRAYIEMFNRIMAKHYGELDPDDFDMDE